MTIPQQLATLMLAVTLGSTALWGCADATETPLRQQPPSVSGQQTKASANSRAKTRTKAMKIRLKLENTTLAATLEDNATSRDFVSLLPLTLTLKDHADTEKVSDLPKKLSTQGAPSGHDPEVGEIAYYAPWGNLALYVKNFEYSSGLVKLGKIDSGVEALKRPRPPKVTIELSEQ
jgi:hypothetical protein